MDDERVGGLHGRRVAALLGVARSTMYALLVRDGAVPCVRRGRRQWITRPVVEALIGFAPPRPSQVARQLTTNAWGHSSCLGRCDHRAAALESVRRPPIRSSGRAPRARSRTTAALRPASATDEQEPPARRRLSVSIVNHRRVHSCAVEVRLAVVVVALTARVTTLRGPDVGAYYAHGLPGYYAGAEDEPAGVWRGQGAVRLGLSGQVDDSAFEAVMAGCYSMSGCPLGRGFGERSVRGFDVTFSAPKSVSVLLALADAHSPRVLAAHRRGGRAAVDSIEAHAHTRLRLDGHVGTVDAGGRRRPSAEHTSRALDPQLHTHVVIANRVVSSGRPLAGARRPARQVGPADALRALPRRSTGRADRRLGVGWTPPVDGIAELATVPKCCGRVLDPARQYRERFAVKLARFVEAYDRTRRRGSVGGSNGRRRSKPARQVPRPRGPAPRTMADEPPRSGCRPRQLLQQRSTSGRPRVDIEPHHIADVDQALRGSSSRRGGRRAAPCERSHSPHRRRRCRGSARRRLNSPPVHRLVDLAARFLRRAAATRRPPGTESAWTALTTDEILDQEERSRLGRAACRRGVDTGAVAGRPGADPAPAGGRRPSPATTASSWSSAPPGPARPPPSRPAVAQPPRRRPALLRRRPIGDRGRGPRHRDRHRRRHPRQAPHRAPRSDRPPDPATTFRPARPSIVDEAAMVPTPKLAELPTSPTASGWRVALVGDPLQFSAVGRGGMFGLLVDTFGAIELDRVHRFAHAWERDASLRLRRGDPTSLDLYEQHGRLHGGTTALDGGRHRRPLVATAPASRQDRRLMAPTNESRRPPQPPCPAATGIAPARSTRRAPLSLRRYAAARRRRDRDPPQRPRRCHRPGRHGHATATSGPSTPSTPTARSPSPELPAGPPSRRLRRRHVELGLRQTTTPPKAAPSTAPSSSSTAPPSGRASTSP